MPTLTSSRQMESIARFLEVPQAELVPLYRIIQVGDDEKHCRMALPIEVRTEDKASGVFTFTASTGKKVRDGNIIDQNGWELKNFNSIGTILYGHDYYSLPIGKPVGKKARVENGNLVITLQFMPVDLSPFADTVKRMVEGDWLKTGSVGWGVIEREPLTEKVKPADGAPYDQQVGWRYTRSELYEYSIAPVPADPGSKKQGSEVYEVRGLEAWKSAEAKGLISFPERVLLSMGGAVVNGPQAPEPATPADPPEDMERVIRLSDLHDVAARLQVALTKRLDQLAVDSQNERLLAQSDLKSLVGRMEAAVDDFAVVAGDAPATPAADPISPTAEQHGTEAPHGAALLGPVLARHALARLEGALEGTKDAPAT